MLSTARVLWISISIHALREEGDLLAEIVKPVELISIHALREEGDAFWLQRPCWVLLFLSTPSARWWRHLDLSSFSTISIISIHALREEGDAVGAHAAFHKGISIHALREEGDYFWISSYDQ